MKEPNSKPKFPGPDVPLTLSDPGAPDKNSQPSFAASSKGLLALKQELLARGMSDEKAEDYLRQL